MGFDLRYTSFSNNRTILSEAHTFSYIFSGFQALLFLFCSCGQLYSKKLGDEGYNPYF